MSEPEHLRPDQKAALAEIGLAAAQQLAFLNGEPVAYLMPTQSAPGVGIVQLTERRFRSGIVEINDPGGGLKSLVRFRNWSMRMASLFEREELELFGAALINKKLGDVLRGQDFQEQDDVCPEELGGGEMRILTRVFAVGPRP